MAITLIMCLTLYVWVYFSVVCHELGHFTCAKLAGMAPYGVKIGSGKKLFTLKRGNAVFDFSLVPSGGVTYASYPSLRHIKVKFLLFILGGPLVNICFFGILSYLATLTNFFVFVVLAFFELMLIIGGLIPMNVKVYGRTIPNDGKQLISALFSQQGAVINRILSDYRQSLIRYGATQADSTKSFLNNDLRLLQVFMQAQTEVGQQNFKDAVPLFMELVNSPQISSLEKAFIYDHLICIVVVQGCKDYLTEADRWSAAAIQLAPRCKTLRGTRGAVLVELGRYEEGKALLLPLTEPGNDAIDIAISSCYIAKADCHLGHADTAKRWLAKARSAGPPTAVLQRIQQELAN